MKKRSRIIAGWRQAPPAVKGLSRKRSPQPGHIAAAPAPTEPPPKAQWETEGGHLAATPVKVKKA